MHTNSSMTCILCIIQHADTVISALFSQCHLDCTQSSTCRHSQSSMNCSQCYPASTHSHQFHQTCTHQCHPTCTQSSAHCTLSVSPDCQFPAGTPPQQQPWRLGHLHRMEDGGCPRTPNTVTLSQSSGQQLNIFICFSRMCGSVTSERLMFQ